MKLVQFILPTLMEYSKADQCGNDLALERCWLLKVFNLDV